MASDRQVKSAQRFSRFSRSNYEDVLAHQSVPGDEPSLADITERALGGHAPAQPRKGRHEEARHQPPPPDPGWADGQYGEPELSPQLARAKAAPPVAERPFRHADPAPIDAEFQELPREASSSSHIEATPIELAVTQPEQNSALPVQDDKRPDVSAGAVDAPSSGPEQQAGTRQAGKRRAALSALQSMTVTLREKAAPALARGAFWLAHNLRRREIRKRYNRLLVFSHTRVVDRNLEQLFFIPTRRGEQINPAPEKAIHYNGPVPSAVFGWIMSQMPEDLRQYAFIDIRAGRGRTTLLASKWNFNRILAYEYDADTFDDLELNVAQYPRSEMACRNIDLHRGDKDGIALPDQPCILYFSGAWREKMIAGIMDYVRDTYRQSPRRIYVVLENTADDTMLGQDSIFDLVEPPLSERLKLRLFSPMDFKVYRSLA